MKGPLAVDEEKLEEYMLPYNRNLGPNSRKLRRDMTPEEKHLWYDFLKKLPVTVRRQHIIEHYIVDFYIAEKKIVIEVDGIQHEMPEHLRADEQRDADLAVWGISVLRYSNVAINSCFEWVVDDILQKLGLTYQDISN